MRTQTTSSPSPEVTERMIQGAVNAVVSDQFIAVRDGILMVEQDVSAVFDPQERLEWKPVDAEWLENRFWTVEFYSEFPSAAHATRFDMRPVVIEHASEIIRRATEQAR